MPPQFEILLQKTSSLVPMKAVSNLNSNTPDSTFQYSCETDAGCILQHTQRLREPFPDNIIHAVP